MNPHQSNIPAYVKMSRPLVNNYVEIIIIDFHCGKGLALETVLISIYPFQTDIIADSNLNKT
jgi:hypothetical protein